MQTTSLDHVNIRTRDLDASVRFYSEVLGLRAGDPPSAIARGQARWLFDTADRPIIHLRLFESDSESTGPIDHVALRCTGKAEVIERLKERGVEFNVFDIPARSVVFARDPHGVMLELNFDDAPSAPAS